MPLTTCIILCYLLLGLLLSFAGPVAKQNKSDALFSVDVDAFSVPTAADRKEIKKIERKLKIVTIFNYPIKYFKFLKSKLSVYRNRRTYEKKKRSGIVEKGLRYRSMGGAGILKCNQCDFSKKVISFLHNHDRKNPWSVSGYQCQLCGKFHEVTENKKRKIPRCECRGKLSRDKAIFCPQCKSVDVNYKLHIIT